MNHFSRLVAPLGTLYGISAFGPSRGQPLPEAPYRPMLERLEQTNPELWNELADNNVERMVDRLATLKRAQYPQDDRVIQVCGMRGGNVHKEAWQQVGKLRDALRGPRP